MRMNIDHEYGIDMNRRNIHRFSFHLKMTLKFFLQLSILLKTFKKHKSIGVSHIFLFFIFLQHSLLHVDFIFF